MNLFFKLILFTSSSNVVTSVSIMRRVGGGRLRDVLGLNYIYQMKHERVFCESVTMQHNEMNWSRLHTQQRFLNGSLRGVVVLRRTINY